MVSKAGNGVRKMNSKRVASTLMALLEAVQKQNTKMFAQKPRSKRNF